MEDNTNSALFTFDSPKGQSSYIKVIGVGGGGGNAVNHMFDRGIEGVDFIVCNTDMKALNASPVPNKIPLGDLGLGAGNKPEAIVTRPFSFEGKRRREQAEAGIEELRKHVDSIIVINNDKLRAFGNMRISEAFGMADDVLLTAAKGIAEIITENAYVNRDFQDVNTVMEHSGTALMGTGSGRGENRAQDAIEAATTSVLLDDSDISGAKNVLLYFSYGKDHEITMDEMGEVADYISAKTGSTDTNVIWGTGFDESLGEKVKITLIATGFEQSEPTDPKRYELKETPEEPKQVPLNNITEPTIVHPAPGAPAPGLNNVVDRVINVSGDYVPPAIQTVDTPVEPGMPQPSRPNPSCSSVLTCGTANLQLPPPVSLRRGSSI